MTLREFDYEKEPVVSIVKKILTDALNMKASDIHFDPTSTSLSIKFRINGTLQEYTIAPDTVKSNITTRIKILSNMNITDSMHPQTGTINFEVEGKHHDLRVSSLPVCDGEKLVLSIHNYENNIKSLSKMGLTPVDTEKIKKLVKSNQGLVLITGTTSSGKTTTMYAMLKEIQSKSLNIISIEDPVKLKIDGINQVEIAPDKGITYKSALKHVMLQDPNIICIDDLINDEIAREAIRASITGRLVISSIYTKNAYTTIDNLLNMDIENYLLGANLNGIISQRLVKQLCPKCKEKRYTTEYEKTIIKKLLNKDVQELYYPKGCEECHNGYVGQIPIVEVVEISDEIRSAITNKKDRKTIRELLYKDNTPIIINGFNKVLEGTTSFNEIIRITDVKIDLDESQNDIKEYILGNTTTIETTNEIKVEEPTKVEDIPNSEVQVVEQKEEPTPVVEEQHKEIKEEVVEVQAPTPVVVKETEPVVEQVVETKQEEPTKVEENSIVVEENTPPTSPTPQKQMPTEGRRLIEEVNELFSDDVEEFNILAEILNDDTPEETPTNEEQPTPAPVETEEPKEETVETVEETPVKEETSVAETQPVQETTEEQTPVVEEQVTEEVKEEVIEEPTKVEEPVQQEINVPAPIEANVVEEKPTTIEEDEDDEDDFGYGEEYENSF
ncbi:MAG: Flp pilus assembly complex ATPase component TadA [Bacilli bacterium]|nr:Flp pilus assembly complex ATPase component TadA [Bacilli bacterium]